MKRQLLTSAALCALAGTASADFSMTILHTNDFHDRYEPISGSNSTCAPEDNAAGECFGGTARLITAIAEARNANENVILVDGGDQFQGTLFYTYYKGKMTAEFMNQLGYDAMTVGNHEFDDGPEVLGEFVGAVEFPILMSNADISQEPLLADAIQKSTTIEVGGETIGLIGLTPEDTDELASPGPNVTFSDPSEAVQAEVDALTAEGVNKIVVLSHSGYSVDQRVAENTTGVDVIVGGHTNTLLGDMEGAAGSLSDDGGRHRHRVGLRLRQVPGRAARHLRRRRQRDRGDGPAAPDRRPRGRGPGRARPNRGTGPAARRDPQRSGGRDRRADRRRARDLPGAGMPDGQPRRRRDARPRRRPGDRDRDRQ